MSASHKAALEWAENITVYDTSSQKDTNLAAAYLELHAENERLKELAKDAVGGEINAQGIVALRDAIKEE